MSSLFSRIFHVVLPACLLAHTILFLLFWLTNRLFYADTNNYLAKMLGSRRDYISICLLISAVLSVLSIALLIVNVQKVKFPLASLGYAVFAVLALAYLAFFYGSFRLLLRESPVQLPRLLQMMLYFRWILDALLLVGISLLAGLWLRAYLSHLPAPKGPVMILPAVMALLILIALWVLPLVSPPDSVYRGSLPKKPSLIAHRGVAMLAPENTLAAVNLAARQGVYGVETDIRISADGIPFLMHDASLERTTNLQEVYPERLKDRPEEFTIAELTQLEAGNWFVARDPFGTVAGGQVSQEEIKEYALQKVPTFAEALAIIRQSNLAFIFDLEPPPGDHPYAKSLFNICFNMIHDAGLDNQVWFLASEEQAEILRANAPEMKIAYGTDYRHPPSVELLQKFGYKMINSEYGLSKALIRKYQEAGLWVNLWTVDEPWQYSRLWLLGVDSTTTNNARTMLALNQPAWSIPYGKYLALWGFMGLASLALVLWLTLPVLR